MRGLIQFLVALSVVAAVPVLHAIASSRDEPVYTKDRVSPEELDRMVEGPISLAADGRLDDARNAFEAQLAQAPEKEKADLLAAFGVGLYKLWLGFDGQEQDPRPAALPYLERSIPATAARFGPGHPEVALALTTYADALRALAPDDPPRRADEAYAQGYEIRRRTLGPGNAETLYSLLRVAQTKGLPTRTGGDPAKIAESAALFDQVIRGREANPDQPDYESPEQARIWLIEMYVHNGRIDEALAAARAGDSIVRKGEPHCPIGRHHGALSFALIDAGREREAEAVLKPLKTQPPECDEPPALLP